MAQFIDIAYKSPVSSANINDKLTEILGKNGILKGCSVVPGSGRAVNITVGADNESAFFINGARIKETSTVTVAIPANSSGSTRTDTVYAYYEHGVSTSCQYLVAQGTTNAPSANACKIAEVDVPNGASSILAGNIRGVKRIHSLSRLSDQVDLLAAGGANNLKVVREGFVSTAGQTIFNLTKGSYAIGHNHLNIYVSGVKQPTSVYSELSPTSFAMTDPLFADLDVLAEWYEVTAVTSLGAGDIPVTSIEGLDGSTVQEALEEVGGELESYKSDYVRRPGYGVASGTNAKTVSLDPAPTSYAEGMAVAIKVDITNTGATTINVNGLGVKSIKKANGKDLTSGNLVAGSVYSLRYNGVNFILQGEGGEYGNALAEDVISGKTIGTEDGVITGTMPNRGAVNNTITSQNGQVTIPNGYHNGSGKIIATFSNLVAGNVKKGVSIGGIVGSLEPAPPQGEQTFLWSGTFKPPAGVTSIDVFMVGGGGQGGTPKVGYTSGGGGGGGGRVVTVAGLPVTAGSSYAVTIGGSGGNTSITVDDGTYTANAGRNGTSIPGGSGGSGGGRGGTSYLQGGSDGSDGAVVSEASGQNYGAGQGSTTRRWGRATGDLYGGGGGGGSGADYGDQYGGPGGAGGGGRGGEYPSGNGATGVSGTGGGGGGGGGPQGTPGNGGTGLVVIRWGY